MKPLVIITIADDGQSTIEIRGEINLYDLLEQINQNVPENEWDKWTVIGSDLGYGVLN